MLAYLFVILAVTLRFVFYPVSFMPVGASLLFFGAHAPRQRAWIPLVLLAISDVALTRLVYAYPFSLDHLVTWAWYAAVLLLGSLLRNKTSPARIAGAGLATAVSFFLISNFAVWAVWNMYPHTLGGLMMSYVAALPFFRNQFISEMLFTGIFFTIPALLKRLQPVAAKDATA